MSEQSSLITSIKKLGFLSQVDLDEVQARQVIYGGDLELNLLELHLLSESQLLTVLSEQTGLSTAEAGYLQIDEERSRSLRASGLMALCGSDTDVPHVFVVDAPSDEDAERIRQLIGALAEIRISSRLRFHEARHFLETGSSGTRAERLLSELGARPISVSQIHKEEEPEPEEQRSLPPVLTRSSTPSPIAEPIITEADPELRPASVRWGMLNEGPISPAAETGPPPDDYEEVARSATIPPAAPAVNASPRATYSSSEAAQDLIAAKNRDRVIDILLHFAAQYFDYTAIFAVLPTEARGLRAAGIGANTEVLKTLKIPLDLPSAFRDAQQSSSHRVARLRASGLEGGIARDMARPTGKKVFLLPLSLRGRTVLLLWGDKGTDDVNMDLLVDLFAFTPHLTEALEVVLLERKRTSILARPGRHSNFPPLSQFASPAVAPLPPIGGRPAPISPQAASRLASGVEVAPPSPEPHHSTVTSARRVSSAPADVHERPTTLRGNSEERTTVLSLPVPLGSPHRRPTQRNTAAPPASQGPRAPTFAPHQVAPADKRSLSRGEEGDSRPPSGFPAELPRTLRGFPDAKSAAFIARANAGAEKGPDQTGHGNAEPADASDLMSRRIVPVQGVSTSAQNDGAPPIEGEPSMPVPPAPPMSQGGRERTARGTLMSRRAAPPEPAESGWESPELEPAAKVKAATVKKEETSTVEQLVDRFVVGDEAALDRLLEHGDAAVGVLVARFPGPTSEPTDTQTPASACGPVLKALVELGTRAAPFLTVRTADEDANIRRWATFVLGEIPGRDAAIAIAGRLLDSAPEVRRAALASARRAQGDGLTRRTIRAQIEGLARDRKLAVEARCSAIEALADIREHEAIPTLLQLIEDAEQSVARASRWALSVLTRQDFGKDSSAWQKFWQEHRNEDRVEWLIESLNHEKRDLRRAAGEELRGLRGAEFHFDSEAPAEERVRAQEEFRVWWKAR